MMPIRPVTYSVLCLLLLSVACTPTNRYPDATTLPALKVPDHLDASALGQRYAVPAGDGRLVIKQKEQVPLPLSPNTAIIMPRVQQIDNDSWLLLPKSASASWSQLIVFLQSRQITVLKKKMGTATVETGWITERAEPGTAVRYQLHLEAGLQPGQTEIHATNITGSATQSITPLTSWKQKPQDAAHQIWFLQQLGQAVTTGKSLSDSLIANAISLSPKVLLSRADGEPVLELAISKNRTFQILAQQLPDDVFTVYEHHQSRGVIYIDEVKQTTLTGRLQHYIETLGKRRGKPSSRYRLRDILAHLPDENSVNAVLPRSHQMPDIALLPHIPGYLVIQKTVGNNERIYIRDGYGRPLPPEQSGKLLNSIKKHLL